ncbi:Predicted dehydrogenase [Pseudomonas cedrina]|uniref:Gfo/Idh/MocA-like oxidoreductase N-terminal domain-containing protein n=2 Tax=Pseudomonas cedrina TaxID=651740 RepID=A0A1V2KGC3_PSECE|nr:Gfo/Idh/MocA family oxidoreductase [Pseudomonas cedrina]ONH56708.1 hypothetical protein BLL36_04850 [Pseudomonas cedrina subsp. cedrina]SDS15370.1 Predicted dehydrogenase [Pseudomonas cedrina]
MLNFLLVGAGQLGSRHLQALALSDFSDVSIQVVDPSSEALLIVQERWRQVVKSPRIKSIEFLADFSGVKRDIDFCIIATNANCRLQVLKALLSHARVRQLVLEKVLFQSVEQLDDASQLLLSVGTQAWVNCPRRMFPIYLTLRNRLIDEQKFNLQVQGSNWGLACNAIHFIDLWAMLSGQQSYMLDTSGLDDTIVGSKRSGYKEVTGTLRGGSGARVFSLTSFTATDPVPLSILIETERFVIDVSEASGECSFRTKESGAREIIPFSVLYQSQLSHRVGRQLLAGENSSCELTSFSESASLHAPFLQEMLEFFRKQDGHAYTLCPIT